jgi:hypothetical protein
MIEQASVHTADFGPISTTRPLPFAKIPLFCTQTRLRKSIARVPNANWELRGCCSQVDHGHDPLSSSFSDIKIVIYSRRTATGHKPALCGTCTRDGSAKTIQKAESSSSSSAAPRRIASSPRRGLVRGLVECPLWSHRRQVSSGPGYCRGEWRIGKKRADRPFYGRWRRQ